MGQPRLVDSFTAARELIAAVETGLQTEQPIVRDQPLAAFRPPWASDVPIVADEDITLVGWPSLPIQTTLSIAPVEAPLPEGSAVGTVTLHVGDTTRRVGVHLAQSLPAPPLGWRLTRRPDER
jgi:hypothetical protein